MNKSIAAENSATQSQKIC